MVSCTACDEDSATRDPFFYRWRDRRFDLYRCGRCTHQFIWPVVSEEDQAIIYSDAYFSTNGDWACGHYGSGYTEAENALRQEARHILSMFPNHGALLDIGCAGGVFLDEARRSGFERVSGIEFNPTMAARARQMYGLDILTARLEDVPRLQWEETFDVTTLLDCLEHIPYPLAAVRKIAGWMKPGGLLVIRGPLSDSTAARWKEAVRRFVRIPKRLPGYPLDANTFNPRSLESMLRAAGLRIVQWRDRTENFANCLAHKH